MIHQPSHLHHERLTMVANKPCPATSLSASTRNHEFSSRRSCNLGMLSYHIHIHSNSVMALCCSPSSSWPWHAWKKYTMKKFCCTWTLGAKQNRNNTAYCCQPPHSVMATNLQSSNIARHWFIKFCISRLKPHVVLQHSITDHNNNINDTCPQHQHGISKLRKLLTDFTKCNHYQFITS